MRSKEYIKRNYTKINTKIKFTERKNLFHI